jgi:hypothetical protein
LDVETTLFCLNGQKGRIKSKSTHSTPRSEARGMLRVDTERRFLPRFKNRCLAPSNVSKEKDLTAGKLSEKEGKVKWETQVAFNDRV